MTTEKEQRIRERAYAIWEQEGRPHGRDLDHRLRAEAEIAAEKSRNGVALREPGVRSDDRERLTRTAEALFRPREATRRDTEAAKSVRKPRVLPSLSNPAVPQEESRAPISPALDTAVKIARSHFPRIRILVRYGMTPRQVAEVCGVAVDEIEHILRTS
jgi:hypothetical protein